MRDLRLRGFGDVVPVTGAVDGLLSLGLGRTPTTVGAAPRRPVFHPETPRASAIPAGRPSREQCDNRQR